VQPETRYAMLGELRLAYQVVGDGPPDLVVSAGSFSHTDALWEDPTAELFLRRLASFSRLIRFDAAGTAASDRLPPGVTRPAFADQLDAVLAATGAERVALLASLDAGPNSLCYVADHPDRVNALILYNTTARWRRGEGYDIGVDDESVLALRSQLEAAWGTGDMVINVPSRLGDARFRSWYAKYLRLLGTPTDVIVALELGLGADATGVLDRIRVPTLVMHRRDWRVLPPSHASYVAKHVPGAELVILPGADGPMYWETPDLILDHLERFVAGGRSAGNAGRRLLTLLFTDIVGSTVQAGQLGDRDWSTLLGVHYDVSDRVTERHHGSVANRTGDGVLCTFASPSDAVEAAIDLRAELGSMAIAIRAGLHAGEVESRRDDVSGIAVHIAARVMSEAGAGEILVSRTVRDLLVGSPLRFASVGERPLKGIDEPWQLYLAES
jgi:class 3 adenylate cyclase